MPVKFTKPKNSGTVTGRVSGVKPNVEERDKPARVIDFGKLPEREKDVVEVKPGETVEHGTHQKMKVDEGTGEITNYEPPKFDPGMDPKKALAEYDRLIKHFEGMGKKYPEAKKHDFAGWDRSIAALKRDRAAFIEFRKGIDAAAKKGKKK